MKVLWVCRLRSWISSALKFEILGITCRGYSPEYRIKLYDSDTYERANDLNGSGCILVNNKPKMLYARILIRKKAGVLFTV